MQNLLKFMITGVGSIKQAKAFLQHLCGRIRDKNLN